MINNPTYQTFLHFYRKILLKLELVTMICSITNLNEIKIKLLTLLLVIEVSEIVLPLDVEFLRPREEELVR